MENKKKSFWSHFVLNLLFGVMIALALYGIHHTGIGQTLLNMLYDHLVREDFKEAMIKCQKQGKSPISDRIRIVVFDQETYEKSASQGYWTPRELLGKSLLRSMELGARVAVIDFAVSRPAPLFCPDEKGDDENQKFLDLLRKAAEIAKENDAVILLAREGMPRNETKSDYEQAFEKIADEYKEVIRWGSTAAFADPSSYYQVRHFQFYEYSTERKEVFLSFQIQASVYLWHGRAEGDRIIRETRERILKGETELGMDTMKPVYLYSQEDRKECLPARYIFRIAPSEIIKNFFEDKGGIDDPLLRYRDSLQLRQDMLLEIDPNKEKIFKDKAVLIGSTYPAMGDEHLTPLGKMSGIFLIANGLNLFLDGLQLHKNFWLDMISEIVMIILSALFFAKFSDKKAFYILLVLILLVYPSLSLQLFSKYGIILDFMLAMLGIGGHRLIGEIIGFIKKPF